MNGKGMDADIIVLSSDTDSSSDNATETSEYSDSAPDGERGSTHHETGTEDVSKIQEIEADAKSDVAYKIDVENQVIPEEYSNDEAIIRTVAVLPALPEAEVTKWVPILETFPGPGLSHIPVIRPTMHHVCSQCCLLFAHPWELTRHMVTHVGEDSQACSHCLKKFKDVQTLELHTSSVHQQKLETDIKVETDHECEAQQKSTILADLMRINEYTEKTADIKVEIPESKENSMQQEKIHPCLQCGRSYGSPWELAHHQLSHVGEQLNKCSHCGMYFSNHDQLAEHIKTHREELSSQCVIEIEDRPQPKQNEAVVNKVIPVVNKVRPKPCQCVYCDKVYDNIVALNAHMEYFHKCSKCPKMLANTADRRVHMQTHRTGKRYKCQHCKAKYYDTKKKLKHHMKNFHECSLCGKMLFKRVDVNRHMLSHADGLLKVWAGTPKFTIDTSNSPHACCQCDLLFCCPYDLTRHMMSHKAPRCHSCPHCQQVFRDIGSLNQHVAAIHSGYSHKGASIDTPGIQVPEQREQDENMVPDANHDVQKAARILADLKQIDEYTEIMIDVKVEIKQEKNPHKCSQCSNSYGTPWELTRHKISHIGQMVNTCPDCGMRLANAVSLQQHMETHVKRSLLCTHCAEEFTLQADFDAHMAAHAQDKPSDSGYSGHKGPGELHCLQKSYRCTACEAVLNSPQEYIRHMMGHSKDKAKQYGSQQIPTPDQLERYKEPQANVGDLTEDYGQSLKQLVLGDAVQDEMNRDLPTLEGVVSLAPSEQTCNATSNPDDYLLIRGGSIQMRNSARVMQLPIPNVATSGHTEQNQYLLPATHDVSSERSRNVQVVSPIVSIPKPNCTTRGREELTMNPHMTQIYQLSTSSVDFATVNQSHTLRHDSYSATMASGQTVMDRSMRYQVMQPNMSSSSLPAAEQTTHTYTSGHSLSNTRNNQSGTSRNIEVIQPMSLFADLVTSCAINESFSAAGRQDEVSRTTQVILPNVVNSGLQQSGDDGKMVRGMQSMSSDVHLTAEKPFQCSQCSDRFYSLADQNQHFRLHVSERDFYLDLTEDEVLHKCSHCHESFHTFDELNRHKDVFHDRNHDASSADFGDMVKETEKPHQCPICGEKFAVIWEVENHMTSHTMPGIQACFICKRWFDTSAQLRQHQATHRKEKRQSPGSCTEVHAPSCNSYVENHKHSSDDFADNSYSSGNLTKHRRLDTDENLSTMTSNPAELSLELSQPTTLRDRMFPHSAEVPELCSVCMQWFSTAAGLLEHQMMYH